MKNKTARRIFTFLLLFSVSSTGWSDIRSRIRMNSTEDVTKKRSELIRLLWNQNKLPDDRLPNKISPLAAKDIGFHSKNLLKIERVSIEMDYKVNSIGFLFIPKKSNNRGLLYHEGHAREALKRKDILRQFLERGYTVLALAMPLTGDNRKPIVNVKGKRIKLENHRDLRHLESKEFTSLRFFAEPVISGINYLTGKKKIDTIFMVGFSGGGWTTTLCAAIDPRIKRSVSIAGSLPLFLKQEGTQDLRDYEQKIQRFLNVTNYLELYVLDSIGVGRAHLQVYNKFDPCCFSGERYKSYLGILQSLLKQWGGGQLSVFLDDSHRQHAFSKKARVEVISFLEAEDK